MKTYQKLFLISAILGLAISGGIHRVAQSQWAASPHVGSASALNMYFTLDNALPAGGYIKVTMPSGAASSWAGCNLWAVTTSLDAPLATDFTSWITGVLSSDYCYVSAGLTAGTVYGM